VGSGTIITTTNGGTSWKSRALPDGQVFLTGISCPSTSDCVAVGYTVNMVYGYASGAVITTTDGGKVWSVQSVPGASTDLAAVSCATTMDCVAVGGDETSPGASTGVAVATTDGGVTWAVQTVPAGIFTLDGVSCASPSDCVAVGDDSSGSIGAIVATTDAGTKWTGQTTPSGVANLSAASCGSTSVCEAVGQSHSDPAGGTIIGSTVVFAPPT
jgi:photosystem II stability/assembly factor-like uncharacterized protein